MTERLLFGPGPSMVSARVMSALGRPVLGHLDPVLLGVMDDLRARLGRVFRAPPGSRVLAISGTGTSAMETAVANLIEPGRKALIVVTGYFGLRLAEICTRYGAEVKTVDAEWGRAVDPAAVEAALAGFPADVVFVVHAETSTGVRNPVPQIAALAHQRGALVVADCVTSLGGQEVDMAAWDVDLAYSGAQKCLGAPSGMAPIAVAPAALDRLVRCRSFYFDLALLEDYWAGRKYHHTICSSLVYAFHEAMVAIEEEGLEARWARHARVHQTFAAGLARLGMSLLPPPDERLMTLNTVRIPDGVNDAAVRTALRDRFSIEIGAGMGPLAGKIWRVGLMGASATDAHVLTLLGALKNSL
jgi:alanine-glyoxylate transaminase/serine-glyoxylate transaminase/serine-pyruvate transaminase